MTDSRPELLPDLPSDSPSPARGGGQGVRLGWLGWLLLLALLGWGLGHLWPRPPASEVVTPDAMVQQPEKIPDEVVISATGDKPESTPVLLPTTAVPLHCFYHFEHVAAGTPLRVTWRLGGQDLGELPREEERAEGGAGLAGQFLFRPPQNAPQFAPGIYQLTFYGGSEEIVDASFVAAAEAEKILTRQAPPAGEIRVVSLVTCTGLNAQGQPQGLAQAFRPTDKVFALFTYLNGVKQARFEVRWLSQDVVIPQATQQVEMKAGAGQAYTWLQAGGPGFPLGACQVQVLVAGDEQPLAATPFTISATAAPPAAPAPGPAPLIPPPVRPGR